MKDSNYSFSDGLLGMIREERGGVRVFDWNKAAEIIRDRKPTLAEAGLEGDWAYTGGVIYEDGEIIKDSYTYLASDWAVPTLVLNDEESVECWVYMDESDFNHDTKWPECAITILNSSKGE